MAARRKKTSGATKKPAARPAPATSRRRPSPDEVVRIVGDRFSAELMARFGVERLWLLLQYLDRVPEIDGALDVLAVRVRTTSAEGDTYLIPFAEARRDELERGLALLDGGFEERLGHLPEGAADAREGLTRALHDALGDDSPRVRVGYRMQGRKTRIQFNLEGVMADRIEDLARALSRAGKRANPRKTKRQATKVAKRRRRS